MAAATSRRIAILAYEGANLLDLSGPAQVFATASEQVAALNGSDEPPYEIVMLSSGGDLARTTSGVRIETAPLSEYAPGDFDTALVAGGHGAEEAARDSALLDWVIRAAASTRRLGSICTGTFILAAAGVLKGRRAATHWAYCDRLQQLHPDLLVERDAIFIEDDGVWTSAGVTAGMDMALAMVEQDWGRELALLVARRLVLFLKRPGGQSQFSVPLRIQAEGDGPIPRLVSWIIDNPEADLRTPSLAEHAAMSDRTFHRLFVRSTGQTPGDFVEQVRLEHARRHLEESEDDIVVVAARAGFQHPERMRRAFMRRIGVSPASYRARFRSAGPARMGARLQVKLHLRNGSMIDEDSETRRSNPA